MINKEQAYANKLMEEIEIARTQHRNGVYKIREKLPDSVATYTRDYLKADTPYRIEFRKCPNCAFEWDILIIF